MRQKKTPVGRGGSDPVKLVKDTRGGTQVSWKPTNRKSNGSPTRTTARVVGTGPGVSRCASSSVSSVERRGSKYGNLKR